MKYAIPDLDIVDVSGMQCGQECEVVDGERLLYIDERHFSKWGARQVGENFRVSFDLPSYIDSLAPPKD
jgi:hypothetical protein